MNNVCVVIKRDKVADSLRDIYLNCHQRIHICKRLTYQLIRLAFIFQFIVVSLKDGMFNNANVLFRTKFVDGVSTVARYAQSTAGRSAVPAVGLNKTKQVARKEDKGAKRPRMAAGENFE